MTERARTAERDAASKGPLYIVWGAAAVFLAVMALLAARVAAGNDPALQGRAAAQPPAPRRVLVKRLYEKRVIVHLPATAPAHSPHSSQQVSASGAYGYATPVTRSS